MAEGPPARRPRAHPPASTAAVHAAELFCETCGLATSHRILHLDPGASPDRLSGVARCQECRSTHRFESRAPRMRSVRMILSEGPASRTEALERAVGTLLRVGEEVPGLEPPARIRRLDLADGRMVPAAPIERIGAVWAAVGSASSVPVSIVEGALTRSRRLELPPEEILRVGAPLTVDGERLYIAALRARARTWERAGDEFAASSVERVYARRTRSPPAGSRDWSSPRPSPSSRTSSTSTVARSRSSPGRIRARIRPRPARHAEGGATIQSSDDS